MTNFILSCLNSRLEKNGSIYGRFLLGPFLPGQGLTVATALRRSLLSELIGIGIIAVEIEGAKHEYSSIIGIRESVLDIILNLKQIILAGRLGDGDQTVAFIKVRGPGEVRARDIKLPSQIYCVNENQHIATLSFDGIFNAKLMISGGKNYFIHNSTSLQTLISAPFESKKKKTNFQLIVKNSDKQLSLPKFKNNVIFEGTMNGVASTKPSFSDFSDRFISSEKHIKIDTLSENSFLTFEKFEKKRKNHRYILPVDAIFMPINKVNFLLEVDDQWQQNKDRVLLEIWTNGSIHPRQAIETASTSLIRLLSPFASSCIKDAQQDAILSENNAFNVKNERDYNNANSFNLNLSQQPLKNLYLLDLGNLNLSVKAFRALKQININTIGELLQYSSKTLHLEKNINQILIDEIEKNIKILGFTLKKTN